MRCRSSTRYAGSGGRCWKFERFLTLSISQLPLIDARDLPFPISETPDVFTPFRKKVEALTPLFRPPLPVADRFKPFPKLSHSRPYPGYGAHFDSKGVEDILPDLLKPLAASFESKYTSSDFPKDSRSAFPYAGGETVALERLRYYFKEGQKGAAPPVATYKVCTTASRAPSASRLTRINL